MICTNSTVTGHELWMCDLFVNAESTESAYCWLQVQWQFKLSMTELKTLRGSQLIRMHLHSLSSFLCRADAECVNWECEYAEFSLKIGRRMFVPFSRCQIWNAGHHTAMTKTTTKLYSYLNVSVNKICFGFGNVLWIIFAMMDSCSGERGGGGAHSTAACNHTHIHANTCRLWIYMWIEQHGRNVFGVHNLNWIRWEFRWWETQ